MANKIFHTTGDLNRVTQKMTSCGTTLGVVLTKRTPRRFSELGIKPCRRNDFHRGNWTETLGRAAEIIVRCFI